MKNTTIPTSRSNLATRPSPERGVNLNRSEKSPPPPPASEHAQDLPPARKGSPQFSGISEHRAALPVGLASSKNTPMNVGETISVSEIYQKNLQKLLDVFSCEKDFLYGLSEPREKIFKLLKQKHPNEESIKVDEPIERMDIVDDIEDIKQVPESAKDIRFLEFLENQEDINGKRFETGRDATARMSKLGVAFAANEGGVTHFLLEGIDMGAVANKKNFKSGENIEPKKNVTGSELRYIFRNWEKLVGKVKFYDAELNEKAPPWEENPKQWLNYIESRKPGGQKISQQWLEK